jgi:exosome complex RNA-binding protein Rrp4
LVGFQRRKTMEDELTMREFLSEGDLVVAEVHNVLADGALQLQARSEKYGKVRLLCPSFFHRLIFFSLAIPVFHDHC